MLSCTSMNVWGTPFLVLLMMGAHPALTAEAQESAAAYCRQAQAFLTQGKYQQAREAAQRALQLDSRSAEAEGLMGTADFALGDLGLAQKHLQRALELQPGSIAVRRTLGATYLKQKRLKDARHEFELVLASHPDVFVSLYSLGLALLLDDQPSAAFKYFEKAYGLKPGDPTPLMGMLEAHLKLKQDAQARATLNELDKHLEPRDPRRLQLAALLIAQGSYGLAIPEFERLRALNPDSYDLNYNLALAYHRVGKEAQASALLESLLGRSENAELENLLGEVEQTRGNHTRALAALRRAAELEPQNEDYRFDYAYGLVRQWALGQALEVFASATKEFPKSVKMWLGWGAAYYLAGRYEDAARTLLRATEIAPQAPEVYYLLGRAYDAAGSYQGSVEHQFSRYMKADPKDVWAQYFYGKILAARSQQASSGDLTEAQQHLERAVALDSNLAEAHMELGNVLEMRGQMEAARGELERAVQLDPKLSAAYYRLAQVYRKLGETTPAQKAVEKFQQLKAQERADLDREQIQNFLERWVR
ncbi:MAG: tetratricopeptide repeat protein [Acidobacteriia bacterium]|nr:tetratricopeptide repeat protein [Terriglobia bacterium]